MKLKTDEERRSTDFCLSKETDGLIANGRVYVKLIGLVEMLLCTCNILFTLDQVWKSIREWEGDEGQFKLIFC